MQDAERLSFNASGNYLQNGGSNRAGTGYGAEHVIEQFGWFARQTDMRMLRAYEDEAGRQINWISRYHNNPYWLQHQNGTDERVTGCSAREGAPTVSPTG